MEHTMTTSISLPSELGQQLNRLAQKMQRGSNWIIVEALKGYLERHEQSRTLAKEARRQSILASQADNIGNEGWEENGDDKD